MTRGIAVAKWRERIERWKRSKMTVTEFCRREQVSQPSFFQWRKRLEAANAEADSTPQFVELRPPSWLATPAVQIALPSGAVVTLSCQASPELIAAVVRAAMVDPREDRSC
jgi:hypothetical protein